MTKPPSSDSSSGPITFLLVLVIAAGLLAMFMAGDEYDGDGVLAVLLIVFVCAIISGGWLYRHHSNAPMILLIALMVQCGGCAMTFMPLMDYFRTQRAIQCVCFMRLHWIGEALRAYHQQYGSFPPAYATDVDGKPSRSWRMLIMPQFNSVYGSQYRWDEPWNGEHNRSLTNVESHYYQCPCKYCLRMSRSTNYVAIVGPHTAWPGAKGSKLADFKDGPANTILLVEIANSDIHWAEPRDLTEEEFVPKINADRRRSPSSRHWPRGVNVLFADGSVRFLPEGLAPELLQALLTPDGGEMVTAAACEAVFPPNGS